MDVDGFGGFPVLGWTGDGVAIGIEDVVAVVVSFPIGDAGLDASACHPCGETTWVVITAVVGFGEGSLGVGGAAKFAAPDYEGIL